MADDESVQRDLGRMEAQIKSIDERGKAMASDLTMIKATLAEARGGWKMLLATGAMSGILGGIIVKISPFIGRGL